MDQSYISANLRYWKQVCGMSNSDIREKTGLSEPTISKHLSGENNFTIDMLTKYAEAFGVSVEWLIRRDFAVDFDRNFGNKAYYFYPYNLILDMLTITGYLEQTVSVYDVYITGLLETIETCLTEREKLSLYYRYERGWALGDIGDKLGFSRERIRQIINKALRKLRFRRRKWQIVTIGELVDAKKEASDYRLKYLILSEKMNKYEQIKINYESAYRKALHVPIDELELSVRAYNCLCRKKIVYVDELTNLTKEDLMQIRNLGRKSAEEICTRLKEKFNIVIFENEEERDAFYRKDQEFC